jgi:hypothetical protein
MDKVAEYRAQEMLCRVRASFDPRHQERWMDEAEGWHQRVQQEIASHFRECNSALSETAPLVPEALAWK